MRAGRALSLMALPLAVSCGQSKRTSSGDSPSSSGGGTAAGDGGRGGTAGGGNEAGDAGEGEGGVSTGGASTGGTPMGGMGGGNAGASGTGGLAGGGGTAGTGGCLSPDTLFPTVVPTGQTSGLDGNANPPGATARSFDGYVIQTPCVATPCEECIGSGWRYEGLDTGCGTGFEAVQNFTVAGTPGQSYRVTLHFYGIVEPKRYGPTVTREFSASRPSNLDTGATPPPWAYADGSPSFVSSDYGTYEIHVVDNDGVDVCSYFLNSDTSEGHWTYVLNYERTINVIGGGRVRVRRFDRNCRIIKNCSLGGSQPTCSSACNNLARVVDISAAMPEPMGLVQPGLMVDDAHSGQWLLIDVTRVQCGLPALGCDGT